MVPIDSDDTEDYSSHDDNATDKSTRRKSEEEEAAAVLTNGIVTVHDEEGDEDTSDNTMNDDKPSITISRKATSPQQHHFSIEDLEYKPSKKSNKQGGHYPQRKKMRPTTKDDLFDKRDDFDDNDDCDNGGGDLMDGLPAFPAYHFTDKKSLHATMEAAHAALHDSQYDEPLSSNNKSSSFASDYFLSQIKTLTSAIQEKNDEVRRQNNMLTW